MSNWRKARLSISTRLALWYGLSFLVFLGLFVAFLYTSIHVGLHADFKAELLQDEAAVLAAIEVDSGELRLDPDRLAGQVALEIDGSSGTYVRLLSATGRVLYHSRNLATHPVYPAPLPDSARTFTYVRAWKGVPARSRYVPLTSQDGTATGWLEVTRLESTLHNELHRLRWLLALGVLAGAAVALFTGYGLSRRALRPVSEMIRAARNMGDAGRGQRLPAEFGVRDELTELAETLNELLGRLDASLNREQVFRADAAHEMLTPIAALQSEIEVAQRKPRSEDYHRETLGRLAQHVERLSKLIEGLLKLSRAEVDSPTAKDHCDASDVVREVCRRLAPLARARGVQLEWEHAAAGHASIQAPHLETIAENLIDNAIKYTPEGGRVQVSLRTPLEGVLLTVEDSGAGLTEMEKARAFDRFFRADREEVRQVGGSGLGLSIVHALVESHGGGIRISSAGPGQGSRIEVHIPGAMPRPT